ncbi:MAG: DUF551 domain-containing protein [Halomonas sp.]|nr:DUF551 domain-containing protein [Halomonas sp.]
MSQWRVTGGDYDAASRGVFTVTKGSKRLDHREQDELEALLAGWVSIVERLPIPRTQVLTFTPGIIGVSLDELFVATELDAEGREQFYFDGDRDCTVTHWMPLPAPPAN